MIKLTFLHISKIVKRLYDIKGAYPPFSFCTHPEIIKETSDSLSNPGNQGL